MIHEIVVDVVADKIELVIYWQGGDHTRLGVKKNKAGQNRCATDADVVELVRVLARQLPDESIAAILNRSGKSTARGNSWTRGRVSALRQHQKIAAYRQGERAERVEVTLNEAAEALPSVLPRSCGCFVMAPWWVGSSAKAHHGLSTRRISCAKMCIAKQTRGARGDLVSRSAPEKS